MEHKFSSDLISDEHSNFFKRSVLQTRKTPKCHLFCKTGLQLKVKGWPCVEKVAAIILALSANTHSFDLQWAGDRLQEKVRGGRGAVFYSLGLQLTAGEGAYIHIFFFLLSSLLMFSLSFWIFFNCLFKPDTFILTLTLSLGYL